jgi:hypothetical protein
MSIPKTIRRGDRGDEVSMLQRYLGINPVANFGPQTEQAVKAFQKANGLSDDGVVGPITWKKIFEKFDDVELVLQRQPSKPNGTNGDIRHNGTRICYTIELPWKNNQRRVSSIPAGRYPLSKRYSQKFKSHILLENVKDRDYILIHPANNAMRELNGCIAPVTALTGDGKGNQSVLAFNKVRELVYGLINQGRKVFLLVKG